MPTLPIPRRPKPAEADVESGQVLWHFIINQSTSTDQTLTVTFQNAGTFTDGAIQKIADYSGGTPRVINIVCDHCLLSGFADSKKRIDAGTVSEAIEYLEEGERSEWKRRRRISLVPGRGAVWAARSGVAVLVMVLIALLAFAANSLGWIGNVPGGPR